MKRVGASTAATASLVAADSLAAGVGSSVASAVAAGDSDSLAAGVAGADAVSESDAGREITTIARRAMPMIAAIKTRGDVPCLGAALGLYTAAGTLFAGVGIVVIFARDEFDAPPTGTGGITNLLAEDAFLAAAFLRAGAFFAVLFKAFFAVFLTTFFAAAFFLAGAFFTTFFAAAFLRAGAFLATFFTNAFFLTATVKLLLGLSDLVWAKFSLECSAN